MTLGELIKEYRSKNNLSMDAFADKSGIKTRIEAKFCCAKEAIVEIVVTGPPI